MKLSSFLLSLLGRPPVAPFVTAIIDAMAARPGDFAYRQGQLIGAGGFAGQDTIRVRRQGSKAWLSTMHQIGVPLTRREQRLLSEAVLQWWEGRGRMR